MTECNEKQSAFQSSSRRITNLHKLKYNTGEFVNAQCAIFSVIPNYCQIQSCNGDASRCAKTNSDSVDLQFKFECSYLNVVGFLMLNLLPRFLEWPLILKLKF